MASAIDLDAIDLAACERGSDRKNARAAPEIQHARARLSDPPALQRVRSPIGARGRAGVVSCVPVPKPAPGLIRRTTSPGSKFRPLPRVTHGGKMRQNGGTRTPFVLPRNDAFHCASQSSIHLFVDRAGSKRFQSPSSLQQDAVLALSACFAG